MSFKELSAYITRRDELATAIEMGYVDTSYNAELARMNKVIARYIK